MAYATQRALNDHAKEIESLKARIEELENVKQQQRYNNECEHSLQKEDCRKCSPRH